ncbi:MAG TPA: hypothetical protein VF310_03600, partial [Vicinamibacteria bacterium]
MSRRGLHRRVALLAAAGTVVPLAVLSWTASAVVAAQARQLAAERQARVAAAAAVLDRRLQETLARLSLVSFADAIDPVRSAASEQAVLHAARLRSGHLEAAFLTDAAGRVRAADPEGAPASLPAAEVEEALRTGRPAVSGLRPGPPPRAFLLLPFRDWSGRIAGLVAAAIDPDAADWAPAPPL